MALLTRLGLTSLALLLLLISDYAIATSSLFDFPACVRSCMRDSETCPKAGARCLCRASSSKDGAYLSTVIECMANSCSEAVFRDAADASFLGLMEAGCKALHKPIGRDILDKAEEHVSKLYTQKFHLPNQTEKPTPTTAAPPAKETTDKDGPGKDKGGKETTQSPKPTTTPGSDDDDDGTVSETASPSVKSPPPPAQTNDRGGSSPETPAAVPNPAPPAPTSPPANPNQGASNQGGGGGGFVDDTPFGDPSRTVGGSSRNQAVMGLLAWAAVLPLAVGLFI